MRITRVSIIAFTACICCFSYVIIAVAQDAKSVTVFGPDHYPSGQQFEVRAEANGCKPRSWEFSTSPGCKVQGTKGDTSTIRCDAGTLGVIRATAKGRGCAGIFGEVTVIVTPTPQTVVLPICNDVEPGAVITPPSVGWYYRPSVESTGRLDLEIVKHTVVAYGCVEPKGKIPR